MAESILTRGADMLGKLEWLIADLKKKGTPAKAEEVDGLSDRLDRTCARLEELEATGERAEDAGEKGTPGAPSQRVSGIGAGVAESVDQVDEQIGRMTRESALCSREDIERLSHLLDRLETAVGDEAPMLPSESGE